MTSLYTEEERRISNLGKEWKYPAWSCREIAEKKKHRLSGWYWIQFRARSTPFRVFCDFKVELLGKKNWMRVLHLNMSNPQHQCPSYYNFRMVTKGNLRLCGRSSGPGCKSMYPTAYGYAYSRVCGSFVGYAYHTPDGFARQPSCSNCNFNQLNGIYLDGFSVTYGRKHLWSLAMSRYVSWCAPPAFVGRNFFCEIPPNPKDADNFYSQDPLFAGQQFCVELPEPTIERLEIRICGDEATDNEDALLQFAELYVQ